MIQVRKERMIKSSGLGSAPGGPGRAAHRQIISRCGIFTSTCFGAECHLLSLRPALGDFLASDCRGRSQ